MLIERSVQIRVVAAGRGVFAILFVVCYESRRKLMLSGSERVTFTMQTFGTLPQKIGVGDAASMQPL